MSQSSLQRKLQKHDLMISWFAGMGSGVVTRTLTSPMDVLKIRFQLQLEPIIREHPSAKYTGLAQAARTIWKEERLTAFLKGHYAGQIMYCLYGGIQFATFEALKQAQMKGGANSTLPPGKNFLSGMVAGVVATVACFPLDCLRTRLVGQHEPKTYKGIVHASQLMYKEGGVRVFYKGLLPALLQIAPSSGLQFSIYYMLKKAFVHEGSGTTKKFLCGAMAGIAAKTVTLPFDLVKKRLQVEGFHQARTKLGKMGYYGNMINCWVIIFKEEGLFGFYKGAAPSILKAMMTVSISFVSYEYFKERLSNL